MTFKKIISFLFVLGLINYSIAQNSVDVINYINNYKQLAIDEMQRTGVPAAIKLAQGIHETEAGTSDLVLKSNNHFGIKCKTGWGGEKVYHDDDARGECFRSYAKPEESYRDHSDFLRNSSRYAFLFQLDATDYKGWAYGLKKAGYATNIKYSQILVRLIEQYNLEQYSLIALGRIKPTDEILAGNNSTPVTVDKHPDFDPIVTAKLPDPIVLEVKPAPVYPESVFVINKTKVVFVKGGVSLLQVAEQNNISLGRLLEFNDMADGQGDVLLEDQLIFLQRKRKVGAKEFYVLQPEETVYDVCQAEGIRYESLLALNQLREGMQPAAGEKLYLINAAVSRPMLASEKKVAEPVAQTQSNEPSSADYTRHVVQTKETLYSISKKYGVAPEKIKTWNKLDGMDLKIGQQLIIYKN